MDILGIACPVVSPKLRDKLNPLKDKIKTRITLSSNFNTSLKIQNLENTKKYQTFSRYSECVPLKEMRTGPLLGEFCMITCHEVIFGFFEMWLIYRDFHSIVTISDDKRKNDDKKDFDDKPPNVVILGIDSTSRLNFRRMMPRTVAKLEELKAVELKGYTKGVQIFAIFCHVFMFRILLYNLKFQLVTTLSQISAPCWPEKVRNLCNAVATLARRHLTSVPGSSSDLRKRAISPRLRRTPHFRRGSTTTEQVSRRSPSTTILDRS